MSSTGILQKKKMTERRLKSILIQTSFYPLNGAWHNPTGLSGDR
jgi:hypothetical protein